MGLIQCAFSPQMLVMDLTHTLEHFPPPQPSAGAVNLLVTVGIAPGVPGAAWPAAPSGSPGLPGRPQGKPRYAPELARLQAVLSILGKADGLAPYPHSDE